MGLFFEDFDADRQMTSRGRTITESDVMTFAGLTGDFVELHTNAEYAKTTLFGSRIAHGALVFSVSVGLSTRMNIMDDTVMAFAGVDKLRFVAPVFLGDTVHVVKKVIDCREMGADKGTITFETRVLNQHGKLVLTYLDKLLVKRRPA